MLPLYGTAQQMRGFDNERPWQVLRLRPPDAAPSHEADTALVRCAEEAAVAKASGFTTALAVGDDLAVDADAPNDLIVLPSRFGYLDDGDVLGFQAEQSPVPHTVQTSFDAQLVSRYRTMQSLLLDVFATATRHRRPVAVGRNRSRD